MTQGIYIYITMISYPLLSHKASCQCGDHRYNNGGLYWQVANYIRLWISASVGRAVKAALKHSLCVHTCERHSMLDDGNQGSLAQESSYKT